MVRCRVKCIALRLRVLHTHAPRQSALNPRVHDMVCDHPKKTTDYTDNTDGEKDEDTVSYPCYPCNQWLASCEPCRAPWLCAMLSRPSRLRRLRISGAGPRKHAT